MKFLAIVLALAISTDAVKVKEEDKAKVNFAYIDNCQSWADFLWTTDCIHTNAQG